MKGKSIVEVVLVYAVLMILARWRFTLLAGLGASDLAQSYIAGILMFIIPLGIIWLTRRKWADYGVTLQNWQYNLDVGLTCYPVRMISWIGGLGAIGILHSAYDQPVGALILTVTSLIEIGVILLIFRSHDQSGRAGRMSQVSPVGNIVLMVGLLLLPIVVGLIVHKLTLDVASTVFWQFVFSGFGEETMFRGYIQSRVNQEFGRPWQVMGVSFGPGLIVAALIFGVSHVLNPYNPFRGQYGLAWWWGLWTIFGGLFFGLVREKTGSLLAPGLAHGLLDAVGEGFGAMFPWK